MKNPATNTTAPSNPPYKWVEESKQRSTFGIISFCSSTLIICIWSTLHFNVPIRRYTIIHRYFLQASWMLIALLAPEVLLYLAINERITAGVLFRKVLRLHPHLAKPGVFTRMYNWIRGIVVPKGVSAQCPPQPHFGLVHAFYAIMGGFAFYESFDDGTPKSLFEISTDPRCAVDVPNFDALYYIMEHFPHVITDITEDHILDRAESSSLTKAILIIQVGWFCTNCASRLFYGLPLSLVEVSTAAHAFCTLLTYCVWWSKPINVATPTLMREKAAREVYAMLKCYDNEYDQALEIARKRAAGDFSMPTGPYISEKIFLAAGALQHLLPTPERPPRSLSFTNRDRVLVPGTMINTSGNDDYSAILPMAISPILYGLIHILAWSDRFPTPLEKTLWGVSSIVVICSGPIEVFVIWFLIIPLKRRHATIGSTFHIIGIVTCVIIMPLAHVLASGFLTVESVRQLFFLDDAAYQLPSWTNYWPHIS